MNFLVILILSWFAYQKVNYARIRSCACPEERKWNNPCQSSSNLYFRLPKNVFWKTGDKMDFFDPADQFKSTFKLEFKFLKL